MLSAKKNGFSIIELLVVIALLSILVSLLITVINPVTTLKRSRDSRRKADLEVIRQALELYRADNSGLYPTGGWYGSAYSNWSEFTSQLTGGNYISQVPVDPINNAAGRPGPCGGETTYRYNYRSVNSDQGYILTAIMEDVDSNNGNECGSLSNWDSQCGGTPATNDYCYGTQNP